MNNDKVPELTINEFENLSKDGFVLIDFFAEWCMSCLMMAPVIDELSEKFNGKIKFGKVNIGENQELAQKFNITSIPNFILFKKGKVIKQFTGSMSSEEMEARLRSCIGQ